MPLPLKSHRIDKTRVVATSTNFSENAFLKIHRYKLFWLYSWKDLRMEREMKKASPVF